MRKLLLLGILVALLSPVGALAQQQVAVTQPLTLPTYAAGVVGQANSSASDVMCINGSATKKVYVKKIRVSAIASAAVTQDISVVKRSTADTCSAGCTPTTLTNVPLDSLNGVATATVTTYSSSSGQVVGNAVGTIRSQKHAIGTASSTAIGPSPVLFDFFSHLAQPVVLRSVSEGICVVVASTAGGSWDLDVEWVEQ